MVNDKKQREWFEYDAQKLIAFDFLDFFRETYQQLLNDIGEYLSRYTKFTSVFNTPEDLAYKENLTREIKKKLAIIVNFLKSVQIKLGYSSISSHVKEISSSYNKIVQSKELPKDELEKLQYHLSAVIAELFLHPILSHIPTKEEQKYGTYMDYDRLEKYTKKHNKEW